MIQRLARFLINYEKLIRASSRSIGQIVSVRRIRLGSLCTSFYRPGRLKENVGDVLMSVVLKTLLFDFANQSDHGLHFILPVVLGLAGLQHVDQNYAWCNIGAEHGLTGWLLRSRTQTANQLKAQGEIQDSWEDALATLVKKLSMGFDSSSASPTARPPSSSPGKPDNRRSTFRAGNLMGFPTSQDLWDCEPRHRSGFLLRF